ncbi:Rrf2 family transcriptional regulator [Sphingobacterium hungaricum]|uniref:Transcriptional regulator n=1 Tax=Sphingobacterium hungaricum TaxID=2082723 RepID=A0A928V1C9_9SPHI|nr:Rrf2 family transcriptional regulator [Sphingobacterium hungaricum]MBE8715191.1 transcriptional regulator [Sphingobacterium hungaricum]
MVFSNLEFATLVHIMLLLYTEKESEDWLTSDYIAGSVGVNAAVVRREIKKLKQAGLVVSKEGKNGGVKIIPDSEIDLAKIYLANVSDKEEKYNNTNPKCAVGGSINELLEEIYQQTDLEVIQSLQKIKLSSMYKNLKK